MSKRPRHMMNKDLMGEYINANSFAVTPLSNSRTKTPVNDSEYSNTVSSRQV